MTESTTSDAPAEAPRRSTITRTPTTSTKSESYGYDASRRVLAVRFKGFKDGMPGQSVYEYPDVSPETVADLDKAESKGKFINATFVKTKHGFEKFPA